jgi:hypothetical protein
MRTASCIHASAFLFLPLTSTCPVIGTELAPRIDLLPKKEFPVRNLICTVLVAVTLLAAPVAMAERDDTPQSHATGWLKAIDFVFVRPLSFALSIASTGVFIGTSPITYPIGAATGPRGLMPVLVVAPWRFTTSRYYGEFAQYRDHRTITGREIIDEG